MDAFVAVMLLMTYLIKYVFWIKQKIWIYMFLWWYLVVTCDKIIEETKTIPINFNEKKATCKTQNFYILLAFLLITFALLVTVNIYCYMIKYQAKQKHLLPFHVANNKLKYFYIENIN